MKVDRPPMGAPPRSPDRCRRLVPATGLWPVDICHARRPQPDGTHTSSSARDPQRPSVVSTRAHRRVFELVGPPGASALAIRALECTPVNTCVPLVCEEVLALQIDGAQIELVLWQCRSDERRVWDYPRSLHSRSASAPCFVFAPFFPAPEWVTPHVALPADRWISAFLSRAPQRSGLAAVSSASLLPFLDLPHAALLSLPSAQCGGAAAWATLFHPIPPGRENKSIKTAQVLAVTTERGIAAVYATCKKVSGTSSSVYIVRHDRLAIVAWTR